MIDGSLKDKEYCYLGVDVHSTPLIILSLVQNAFKFGRLGGTVKLWYEETDRFDDILQYLCITNEIKDNELVDKNIISECLRYPIGKRRHSNDGITLYAVNCYCDNLLRKGLDSRYRNEKNKKEVLLPEELIEVCINDSKFTIKIPVLRGKELCVKGRELCD